jgi:hypothetical protein
MRTSLLCSLLGLYASSPEDLERNFSSLQTADNRIRAAIANGLPDELERAIAERSQLSLPQER